MISPVSTEGAHSMKHVAFAGRLVMLGCGSIGQGVLPLILRHIEMPREQIHILTADARGSDVAAACGVAVTVAPVTRDNYRDLLLPLLRPGDFLLNLSVDVSSVALIALCQELGALYLDTCIEPWVGGYTDPSLTPSQRSNYALRESALALAVPVWCRISSSRRCSTSRATPASTRWCRHRGRIGRRWRRA
jgi:homospermidine synthase